MDTNVGIEVDTAFDAEENTIFVVDVDFIVDVEVDCATVCVKNDFVVVEVDIAVDIEVDTMPFEVVAIVVVAVGEMLLLLITRMQKRFHNL